MNGSGNSHIRRVKRKLTLKPQLSPTQIILLGFLALILIGGTLLILPISSANGTVTSPRSAYFTAVSASCVTGLVAVDTGTHWSLFGQLVILTMIQIGGLGFMTMAVMMSMFIKRQITPHEQLLVAQSLGLTGIGGAIPLVRRILIGTFAVEGIGAVILATQFIPLFGWGRGIFCGIFHSISFFCNAGFDILGWYGGEFSSLTAFSDNYIIGITTILLVVIGGIGFVVWDDFIELIKHKDRLSVYSKLVLTITAVLIVGGTLLIALCEWNNPDTIADLSPAEKLFQCLFQSVTTRTAGVDMINNAAMTDLSKLVSMLLMFIGGASGSTAGGIKVNTFGILILAVIAFAKGEETLVIGRRRVPHDTIIRALAIVGMDLAAVFASVLIIMQTGGTPLIDTLYEAFSGIATVGLSLGLTPSLTLAGHISIMLLMFFGRVGMLTITYSVMLRKAKKRGCISYPEISMMLG